MSKTPEPYSWNEVKGVLKFALLVVGFFVAGYLGTLIKIDRVPEEDRVGMLADALGYVYTPETTTQVTEPAKYSKRSNNYIIVDNALDLTLNTDSYPRRQCITGEIITVAGSKYACNGETYVHICDVGKEDNCHAR